MLLPPKREIASRAGAQAKSGGQRKSVAALGEQVAADFLVRAGYKVIARNWRSGRFGEVDIIAVQASGLLVFAEVKTRKRQGQFGFQDSGLQAIDWRKQRKLKLLVQSFLAAKHYVDAACRIDVMLVLFDNQEEFLEGKGQASCVLHVPAAIC